MLIVYIWFGILTHCVQFGQLMRPVFESYGRSVSAADGVDVGKSVMGWVRDYLSLIALRPGRWTVYFLLQLMLMLYCAIF